MIDSPTNESLIPPKQVRRPIWKTTLSAFLAAISAGLLVYFLGILLWPIEHRIQVYVLMVVFAFVALACFFLERMTGKTTIAALSIAIIILATLPVVFVLAMSLTPRVGPFGGPAYAWPVVPHVCVYLLSVCIAAFCCWLEKRSRRWYYALSPFALLAIYFTAWLIFRIIKPS